LSARGGEKLYSGEVRDHGLNELDRCVSKPNVLRLDPGPWVNGLRPCLKLGELGSVERVRLDLGHQNRKGVDVEADKTPAPGQAFNGAGATTYEGVKHNLAGCTKRIYCGANEVRAGASWVAVEPVSKASDIRRRTVRTF
jgi:hypothetical protein